MTQPRLTALGGGHGLYACLSALRPLASDITAVVTVADDGGSSGRLRSEMGIVPPGDLRMALSALCDEGEWGRLWRDVLQTRFATEGPLDGHSLGNLLIAGMWERTGDVVEGLRWVGELLHARGRVLPLAEEPLEISAIVTHRGGSRLVKGQVAVAKAKGMVSGLGIEPVSPRVPEATVAAVRDADTIVLGPGSWYTSVLVHFLVPSVAEQLVAAGPRTILTLNIAHEDPETEGAERVDDVRALRALEPRFTPAVVLVDSSHSDDPDLVAEIREWGARLVIADMRSRDAVDRHEVSRLSDALADLVGPLAGVGRPPRVAG